MSNYKVNWYAAKDTTVLSLPEFAVTHSLLKFKTPVEGNYGFVITHRGTGVRMFEGVDIAYAVRKAIAEQLLLDQIRQDPELGVQHPRHDDVLESFSVGGPAN